MGGFVQWFATAVTTVVQAAFAAAGTSEYRSKALASTARTRPPDIVARLSQARLSCTWNLVWRKI